MSATSAATHTAQPQPAQPHAARAAPPPSARHASTDAFLQATCTAWGHLQPADRKAVRASCRGGRLQHDRLLTHLQLTLGATRPQEAAGAGYSNNNITSSALGSPTADQIRASLQAVLARGARLGSLTICFTDDRDGRREAQMQAALAACSGCPLSRLVLEGAVPITGPTAEAVLACCPLVNSLTLDHERYRGALVRTAANPNQEASMDFQYGCILLLSHCGPRLTHLRLWVMDRGLALLYKFVPRCTALTSLELGVQRADPYDGSRVLESLAIESTVYTSVPQLTGLRSLHLRLHADERSAGCRAVDLKPHAAHLARLSSLTALTHLHLDLHSCYQHTHNSWYLHQLGEGNEHDDWCNVREAHRTTLLSVLGHMKQLQHLHCPTLWLAPAEAAPLTALTGLHLGGLLPTRGEYCVPMAGAAGGRGGPTCFPVGSLPPLLRELHLHGAEPARLLAGLQLPSSLACLSVNRIRFGMSDMAEEDGRLTQEAVQAVGPVVRRLVRYRGGRRGSGSITILGEGSACRMQPREGSPEGHVEWVRQLQGLDCVVGHLTLDTITLSAEDLRCLGETLPHLKGLHLCECAFPVAALPSMRQRMSRLTHLQLDVSSCRRMCQQELASVLLQLCGPHPGAEQLQHLVANGAYCWLPTLETRACKQYVLEQLATRYGVTGVLIVM